MQENNEQFQEFPDGSRQLLQPLWNTFGRERQQELLQLLPALPTTPGKVQKIFELGHQQLQMSFGNKHNVAIVGPANVGKSTLFNHLIASRKDAAEVSPIPGTTRVAQEASAGPFTIVDTPGADAVGATGDRERELALQAAAKADFLIILFDATQGIRRSEQELFAQLRALYRPYIVVLNKVDMLHGAEGAIVAQVATNLGLETDQVIPISALRDRNLDRVVAAIVKAQPALLVALGQGLPAYRAQLAWQVITGAATTAAFIALTPLPFVDFLPLLAVQSSMVLGIGRIYDYPIRVGRLGELGSVFGLGFLGRSLFYELVKLGGPPTWVIASAVAAGTTVTMGYGAMLWFSQREELTKANARQISKAIAGYLLSAVKNPRRIRLSRAGLQRHIEDAVRQTLPAQPIAATATEEAPQITLLDSGSD